MRLNKYLSEHTELSRRKADAAIKNGRVSIDGETAKLGTAVDEGNVVSLDGNKIIASSKKKLVIILNKPIGYVCSKDGQGSKTVYDLIPAEYSDLNIAGRLDKDSSGLVIMTNDGTLQNELTHPSNNKLKVYDVSINKPLLKEDQSKLLQGVDIGDERPSRFKKVQSISDKTFTIIMEEGRNRQIRRAFESLGYEVKSLHRTAFGQHELEELETSSFKIIK